MFNKRTIFEQVHLHLKAIRNPELENTLRFLNYKQSTQLLYYLEHFIRNVRFFPNLFYLQNIDLELSARAVFFILETYQQQIQMTIDLQPLLKSIAVHLRHHFKSRRVSPLTIDNAGRDRNEPGWLEAAREGSVERAVAFSNRLQDPLLLLT